MPLTLPELPPLMFQITPLPGPVNVSALLVDPTIDSTPLKLTTAVAVNVDARLTLIVELYFEKFRMSFPLPPLIAPLTEPVLKMKNVSTPEPPERLPMPLNVKPLTVPELARLCSTWLWRLSR